MKKILAGLFVLLSAVTCIAQAPMLRTAYTTNSGTIVTNIIKSLSSNVVHNTWLPSSNLVGALPAIDGSQLMGIATGSATNAVSTIKTNGGTVGTDVTILNFTDSMSLTGGVSGSTVTIGIPDALEAARNATNALKIQITAEYTAADTVVSNGVVAFSVAETNKLDTDLRTAIAASATNTDGTTLGQVRGVVQTNSVRLVLDHIPQPFDVSNLVVTAIGDSHTEDVSFPWLRGMMALAQWQGTTWTNAAYGGSTLATTTGNQNAGTNILWQSLVPWVQARMSPGKTWLFINGHGTVDQISGIALVGGITNYINIESNMIWICKYIIAVTNGWNFVAARPTMVMQGQNMKVVGSFSADNPRRFFNNWLARDQTLYADIYGYNNTNLYDIVVDYAREFPDNNDLRYWHPDFIHTSLSNSVPKTTWLWDRTLRGELPRIPRVFGSGERDGQGWVWYPPKSGTVQTYLWEAGDGTANTRTNRGFGGDLGPGAWTPGFFSPDGTFPNQVSGANGMEAVAGNVNNSAGVFHGLPGQVAPVIVVKPAGGASVFSVWTNGMFDVLGDGVGKMGSLQLHSSGAVYWQSTSTGRSNYLDMASDGSMQLYNATNFAKIMGIGGTGRIYTPEAMSANYGYWHSNIVFYDSSIGGWGAESDVVFIGGSNTTLTLSTAFRLQGKPFTFVNVSGGTNFIAPLNSSQPIMYGSNALTSWTLYPGDSVNLLANSTATITNWHVTSSHINPNILSNILWTTIVNATNGLTGGSGSVTNAIASVSSNGVMIISSGATNLNFVNANVTNANGNVSVGFTSSGGNPQTNISYVAVTNAPWLNTNTVNATLTNLIMTGTGTKLPPLTELGFDSSTESGWLQIQSDRTLQRTFDGSSLTNLTSANLVGALPAIDGSALTGITASGIDPRWTSSSNVMVSASNVVESQLFRSYELAGSGNRLVWVDPTGTFQFSSYTIEELVDWLTLGGDRRFTSVSNSIIALSNVFHAPTLSTSNLIGGITVSGGSLKVDVNQTNTAALRISGGYHINPVSNIWVNWNIPASRFVAFTNLSPSEVGTPSPGSQFVLTSTNNQLTNITMTLPFNAFSEQQNQTVGSVTLYAASEQAFRFTYDFTSDGSIYRVFEEGGPNNTNLVNLSSDGDKGDITISSQGAVMTVDSGAIVVSEIGGGSEDKLVGRASSGTGNLENINLSADFDIVGGVLTWIGASSSGTGMRTNQFTTNVVGAAIVGAVTFSGSVTNSSDMKVSGTLFSGDILAAGSVTGDSFSGQGTGLTDLNASNLGSGTVPFARAGSLTNHTDVAITALATGHVLGWDEATDKWTNGPPSAASGGGSTTITQTNFVLNTTYTNGSQAVIVRGTIDVTVAAVNGSGRMELMVDQTGGITFATLSRAGIDTTVAVTLAGVDYREIAGDIKPGALYYFTNASFGAGNAAAIRAGTGQIITISSGTNGATGATGATGAGGTNTFYPETDPDLRIKLGGDSMFWQTFDGNGDRIGYMDNANLVLATGNLSVGATLTVTNQAGAANRMALFGTDGAITAGAPATATTQNLAVVAFNNNGTGVTNISGMNIKWPTNGSTDNALIDLAKGYVFTNHTANFTITGFLASSVDLSNTNVQWATYTYTNNSVGAKTITLPSSWLDLGSKGNPVYNTNIGTLSVIRYPSAFTNYVWVGR